MLTQSIQLFKKGLNNSIDWKKMSTSNILLAKQTEYTSEKSLHWNCCYGTKTSLIAWAVFLFQTIFFRVLKLYNFYLGWNFMLVKSEEFFSSFAKLIWRTSHENTFSLFITIYLKISSNYYFKKVAESHIFLLVSGNHVILQRLHKIAKRKQLWVNSPKLSNNFFFLSGFLFPEHSWITGLQGMGEGIPLTPHYNFYSLHRHLDLSWAITAESSPLHIASSQTRTGNLWFPRASR